MEIYAVIMAGGAGTRFWPRSKEKKPKQLIRIIGSNTMIQDTVYRLKGLIDEEKIFIITNKIQKLKIKEQLPQINPKNIIDEPFGKNTAACIGLAAILLESYSNDALMVVLPADHIIKDVDLFQSTIKLAVDFAYSTKKLITIGIKPTRPETGYGYIQFDDKQLSQNIHKVLTFAEKPNFATARRFIESGDFLWNSGMFVWRVDVILNEIKTYMPDLYDGLQMVKNYIGTHEFEKVLTQVYGQLKNISIDYGILEKSDNVAVVKGDFYWNDVGSWEAVYEISEKNEDGNVIVGDVYTARTYGSYIFSPRKFTAVIGVENLIVIDTTDALLICHRNNAQEVREVVDYLKMNKRTELL
ncbi:mannose-1-phosphate guanylyltransferase [Melioribacteraceae bacterium 4301-Me]|uniref:mannose-1-phosphate guanylyltransferase n=1 Tax=Pyranulibacter aquaticus TaxID=3163344 RepID=UPI00359A2909